MHYRILPPEEWNRLGMIVDRPPNPQSAIVAVAEDDTGTIAGALFLQLALHMEPLILKTPKVSFVSLYRKIMETIEKDKGVHFYAFSDKEIVDKMAVLVGMKTTPFRVFEGEVK